MVKKFRKIHLWLGITFGLFIALMCFSGAMLAFEKEITHWVQHDRYYVEKVGETPLPLSQIMSIAKANLPEGSEISGLTVYQDKARSYEIKITNAGKTSLLIDQYSGKYLGRSERIGFFDTMFRMHRWMLGSPAPGKLGFSGRQFVGVATIAFMIILISGIFIWRPRLKGGLKKSLSIKRGKGARLFWSSLHVSGGMYVLIFLLVMGLTGLTWSFKWYNKGFYALMGVEMPAQQAGGDHPSGRVSEKQRGSHSAERGSAKHVRGVEKPHGGFEKDFDSGQIDFNYIAWENALMQMKMKYPSALSFTVDKGKVSVPTGNYGNVRGADIYTFNPDNGELLECSPYSETPASGKLRGWIYSIHTGQFGGVVGKFIWMISALFGCTLPLTGFYLYAKKKGGNVKSVSNKV